MCSSDLCGEPPPHSGAAATGRRGPESRHAIVILAARPSRGVAPARPWVATSVTDSLPVVSPVATTDAAETIVTITPAALDELLALRDTEPDADTLGLRLEVISKPGEDFAYDLSFDVVTKAAFTDEVRTHRDGDRALKVIVPATSIDLISGATLDHSPSAGLVIRNPNKPLPPTVEGLVRDDELSARIETVVQGEVNPALAEIGRAHV